MSPITKSIAEALKPEDYDRIWRDYIDSEPGSERAAKAAHQLSLIQERYTQALKRVSDALTNMSELLQ